MNLLLFTQVVGCIVGRLLWPLVGGGKDPQIAMAWANGVGFIFATALYLIFRNRLSRHRVFDVLVAFALGVLSSVVGMGWGILNGY